MSGSVCVVLNSSECVHLKAINLRKFPNADLNEIYSTIEVVI